MTYLKCYLIVTSLLVCISLSVSTISAAPQSASNTAISGQRVSNSVVSLGISGARGGSIDSFKVLGVETIDTNDLGREIQTSLVFNSAQYTPTCPDGQPRAATSVINPQEAGDICGRPSNVYGLNLGPTGSGEINSGSNPRDWQGRGYVPPGLRIEGNHKIGPLPYVNANEAVRLLYTIFSDQQSVTFDHTTPLANGHVTPVPFLPAMYFKGNVLTRLYGLSLDGTTWTEVTPTVFSSTTNGQYNPSLYRFRAMAWMNPQANWGVALYGRWTLTQGCNNVIFPMTLANQVNQCPNFAAIRYPSGTPGVIGGVNNLSLVDQTLGTIPAHGSVSRMPHLVVGDQATMQRIINQIYSSGN